MASTATAPCTAQPLHAPPAAAGSRRRGDRRLLAPGLHRFHLDLHPRCRPLLPARMCLSGTCPHQQGEPMLHACCHSLANGTEPVPALRGDGCSSPSVPQAPPPLQPCPLQRASAC